MTHHVTIHFGDRPLRAVPLDRPVMRIGRDPSCEIHLDSLALEPVHAVIETDGGQAIIRAASETARLTWQGDRVTEHRLSHGDRLGLGKFRIAYQRDAGYGTTDGKDPQPHACEALLQFLDGASVGRTLKLGEQLTRLGKAGQCQVLIAGQNGRFHLTVLEDTEPPLVDGKPLTEPRHRLRDGEILQLGKTRMMFIQEAHTDRKQA